MKTRALLAIIAVPLVAGVAWTGVALGAEDRSGPRTVTFTEINHPDTDVDLDLGPAGLSLGDEQIFHATLQQRGRDVGDVYGVGTVVQATDTGLASQVVSTAIFPDGTFTLQLLFQINFQNGPPATRRGAITGGTGSYRGATGQCVSTVIPNTENNSITCNFG
jgi:hypothetical protein